MAHYVRARPGYPRAVIELLVRLRQLGPQHRVADVGCGTGNLARLFLDHGNPVIGVEPNREMREAAAAALAGRHGFSAIDGRAEATRLDDASVDVVAAGQAFHWFDPVAARTEFGRILRPPRLVVLVWNDRRVDASPFMAGYERLLERHGTDYAQVHRRREEPAALADFYGEGRFAFDRLGHRQEFDLPGLVDRLLSSSYVPAEGQPGHEAILDGLRRLFARHEQSGRVAFEYTTRVYHGHLAPARDR